MAGEMNVTAAFGARPAGYERKGSAGNEANTLGQDAFLQILVAQLKYQDPLQPMQDREFISQMALFSTVEQLTRLNQTVTELKDMINGASPSDKTAGEAGTDLPVK